METTTEYPKALYPSADQRSAPVVVHSQAEENKAREEGAKPLAEWWEATGVPDDEPDAFFAARAQAVAQREAAEAKRLLAEAEAEQAAAAQAAEAERLEAERLVRADDPAPEAAKPARGSKKAAG